MNGKNGLEPGVTEAMAAPARAQNAGDGAAMAGPPLRFSAKRKLAAVGLMGLEVLDDRVKGPTGVAASTVRR